MKREDEEAGEEAEGVTNTYQRRGWWSRPDNNLKETEQREKVNRDIARVCSDMSAFYEMAYLLSYKEPFLQGQVV